MNSKLRFLIGLLIPLGLALCLAGCSATGDGRTKTATADHRPTTAAPALTTTLAPSATATEYLTTTPRATITPRPTATRTPTVISPEPLKLTLPTTDAASYQLRAWSETDCLAMADRIAQRNFANPTEFYDVSDYAAALQAECLLRYRASPDWIEMAWEMASIDPSYSMLPELRPRQGLFAYLVEDLLNNKKVSLSNLLDELKIRGFSSHESIGIENLFGDGQTALVFETRVFNMASSVQCGINSVRQINGRYQVQIIVDWMQCEGVMFGVEYDFYSPDDTNANSLPELKVVSNSAIGGPAYSTQTLWLYEWNPSNESFNTYHFDILSGYYYSDQMHDGDWNFSQPDEHGLQKLTVNVYFFIKDGCPDLTRQRTYLWDGAVYALEDDIILPPPDGPLECRIDWAYSAGQNDQAIGILAEALDHWPEAMNQEWGPASLDYFRLHLGIWRDLRGESSQALALLQALAGHPSDPQFDLPARLASEYLDMRAKAGIAGACYKVEQTWDAEYNALEQAVYPSSVYLNDLRERWGFANPFWFHAFGGVILDNLCEPYIDFTNALSTLQVTSPAQLESWFETVGIAWLAIEPADLDGDGADDWLALIPGYRQDISQLWAFVKTPNGARASYIGRLEASPDLTLRSFRLASGGPLINIASTPGELKAFYVAPDGKVNGLLSSSFIVYWVDTAQSQIIIVRNKPGWDTREQVFVYTWNGSDDLTKREIGYEYDYDGVELEAGRLLFVEQDFPAAIQFITDKLDQAPPESRDGISCGDALGCNYNVQDWHAPYLRYLLALAYEMDGQPDQASLVYYGLWLDYPTHIFGMVAAAKLEPRNP